MNQPLYVLLYTLQAKRSTDVSINAWKRAHGVFRGNLIRFDMVESPALIAVDNLGRRIQEVCAIRIGRSIPTLSYDRRMWNTFSAVRAPVATCRFWGAAINFSRVCFMIGVFAANSTPIHLWVGQGNDATSASRCRLLTSRKPSNNSTPQCYIHPAGGAGSCTPVISCTRVPCHENQLLIPPGPFNSSPFEKRRHVSVR